ncbi:MAG: deoxyguanosinetriphosphate triphosphohydrolase [Christensenellales bacterium]|jgi:dGTPase
MNREYFEQLEMRLLSPFAAKSVKTRGRLREIEPCPLRPAFQRDRDRVLHCKAFRRMKHKTQVFLSPEGDHYRTRLTHTLEVAQIARTIARGLLLNEDLTEAIALGHDLGHTPFGHVGERVLDNIAPFPFSHNQHSLRVVDILENGVGLNLTFEVRDGIVNHTSAGNPATLEGRVVHLADRIAYINHDIDDAIRAGILRASDLPKACVDVLGNSHGKRINTMILDVITSSEGQDAVFMSPLIKEATDELRQFMFDHVYLDSFAKREEGKAHYILEMLYQHLLEHPDKIGQEYQGIILKEGVERAAVDDIAGMTDRFSVAKFQEFFVPKNWGM